MTTYYYYYHRFCLIRTTYPSSHRLGQGPKNELTMMAKLPLKKIRRIVTAELVVNFQGQNN